ncbi:MAG TPA: hypothetical protein VFF52_01885 [Isosphaeraceae bacterium]|nr:hypothetical protein [Isosphaeraceae bacterium]
MKKNMEVGDPEKRRRIHAAIRKAARVARRRGVPVVPLKEAREHLQAMFDDPFERARVIAAYDSLDDVIVFNPDHGAWLDMDSYLRGHIRFFSTQNQHHLVRHELGHRAHYRLLTTDERSLLWHADLTAAQRQLARSVSGLATWSGKEFVAEVYAGLWAGLSYDGDVMTLFDRFRGPRP